MSAMVGAGTRADRVVAAIVVVSALVLTVVLHLRHPDALVTKLPSPDMRELHLDFDTFWHSAVALVQGQDIYATDAKLRNLNPPLMTVLLAPFAAVDALTGYRIWAGSSVLMVLGAIVAVARELRLRRAVTAAVVVAVAAASPLHGTLVLGQIYPLLLVGLVSGWIAGRRGRPLLGAALIGVTVALKPSLAPVLLLPAALRRWDVFGAGICAAAGATAVGVAVAGPSSAWAWLRIALGEGTPDSVDNASFPGLAVRIAGAAGVSPGAAASVGLVVGVTVLAFTLIRLGRYRSEVDPAGTAMWAVVAAGLLCSPIAWHNYLMLLWPGVLILFTRGRGALATAAVAAALVPVSWNAEWPPEGWVQVVARSLYFAILLAHWWLLLRTAAAHVPATNGTLVRYVGDERAVRCGSGREAWSGRPS